MAATPIYGKTKYVLLIYLVVDLDLTAPPEPTLDPPLFSHDVDEV